MSIYVETAGHGPALTLLHGWGLNGAVWNSVRESLAERHTLHIVDLPGHGHSHGGATTSISAMADAVAGAMPDRSHVLGWSLGGMVALELARRHASRIYKLILVATTPCFLQRDNWPHAVQADVLAGFGARLTGNYAATIKSFLALQALRTPNIRDTIHALNDAITSHGSVNLAALAAALEILRSTDVREHVAKLTPPALVIQGDHDALTREPAAKWLAQTLPNASYAMIAHAAHAPFLSHRDEFLRHLNTFLTA